MTARTPPERLRRPVYAMLLMLGATMAFVLMQAVVKQARQAGLHTSETMFLRTAPGLPVLWWTLRSAGHGLRPARPRELVLRSVLGSLAMSTNFTSMRALTLAQFSTLGLSQPVFVALLSPSLLGERLNRHAWAAMGCAVAGAFLLIAPGLEAKTLTLYPALLALISAVFSAFAHIWVRKATEQDPPERVVFHFALLVAVASLAFGLLDGHFARLPPGMSGASIAWLALGLSGLGTLGQVLMTRAHAHGDAPTVALVGYASIALSMLLDVLVFGAFPVKSAYVGAGLMVCAGVVLVHGARLSARLPSVGAAARDGQTP